MRTARSTLRRFGTWPYVVGWATLILAISSIPNFAPPSSPRELNIDKVAHFALFFVLAALAYAAARRSWPAARAPEFIAVIVVAAALFGALDEAYQALIPGRDTNALDWVADLVGAIAGALFAAWALTNRRASEFGER